MLNTYDLYDISAVFKTIRAFPDYEKNDIVLKRLVEIINSNEQCFELNQIRLALGSIENLDKNIFYFVDTKNIYTHFPGFLKDEYVYNVLIASTEELINAIKMRNVHRIVDIADCLHNLPVDIANNNFRIKNYFWKNEVKSYRKKWNKRFLYGMKKHNIFQ